MANNESVISIDTFTGLNGRDAPGRIKNTELVECQNFDLGVAGELTKRTGFKNLHAGATLGANAVTLLGYFQTDTLTQLLARAGTSLYYSTDGGITWAVCPGGPHGNVEWGVQYTNKFYFVRRDAVMLEWNGTTMTAITGSPMGSHVVAYKDRLFVLNTYAAGLIATRFYYSKVADFSATGWPSTNFIDVGQGDGDVNVCFSQVQDVLIVFKSRSTWLLYVSGDPTTWTLRNSSPEIGCISRYTPREIESSVYFVGLRGVYRTDGSSFVEISKAIQYVFVSQSTLTSELNKTFAGWWQDKYIVFLSLTVQSSTWASQSGIAWQGISTLTWNSLAGAYYQVFTYYLRSGGWTRWEPAAGVTPFSFVEINQPSTSRGLISGSRSLNGKVYRYGEALYQDEALNYECRLKTKEFDIESPARLKRGKLISVEYDGAGEHSFQPIVNALPVAALTITSSSGRFVYKIKGSYYFRLWQFAMTATHGNPITLYGVLMFLHPKGKLIKNAI